MIGARNRLAILLMAATSAMSPAVADEPEVSRPGAESAPGATRSLDPLPHGAISRVGGGRSGRVSLPGVYRIAFSPDAKLMATRHSDQVIRLWDVAGGKLRSELRGHEDRVLSLAFSPDGRTLVSASPGRSEAVQFWDAASGRKLHRIAGGASIARFVAGGTLLAVVANDRLIRFEASSGRMVKQFATQRDLLALSPDGALVATIRRSDDTTIEIIDALSGSVKQNLTGLVTYPVAIAFSDDNRMLAVAGRLENTIRLWSLEQPQPRYTLTGHNEPVQSLSFSPDGRMLATASWDKTVRVWEILTGGEAAVLAGHDDHVCAVTFSSDGRLLATGASGPNDNSVLVWNLRRAVFTPDESDDLLGDGAFATLWGHLADARARRAYRAMGELLASSAESVDFFDKQLASTLRPSNFQRVAELIDGLDHDDFQQREAATQSLVQLRPGADAALRHKLQEPLSTEARLRIQRVLRSRNFSSHLSRASRRRMVRLVHLLEISDNADATKLLVAISTAHPSPEVVAAAKESLMRLAARD